MADDGMALIELIEKGADTDLVRRMLAFAAERLLEAEVGARAPRMASETRRAAWRNATAIASGPGKPGPAASTWQFPG